MRLFSHLTLFVVLGLSGCTSEPSVIPSETTTGTLPPDPQPAVAPRSYLLHLQGVEGQVAGYVFDLNLTASADVTVRATGNQTLLLGALYPSGRPAAKCQVASFDAVLDDTDIHDGTLAAGSYRLALFAAGRHDIEVSVGNATRMEVDLQPSRAGYASEMQAHPENTETQAVALEVPGAGSWHAWVRYEVGVNVAAAPLPRPEGGGTMSVTIAEGCAEAQEDIPAVQDQSYQLTLAAVGAGPVAAQGNFDTATDVAATGYEYLQVFVAFD